MWITHHAFARRRRESNALCRGGGRQPSPPASHYIPPARKKQRLAVASRTQVMRARRPVEMVGLPLRALPTPTSRTLTPQAERRSEAVASERAREVSIAGVLVELCECRGAAPRPVAANGRSERAKRVSKPIGGVTDTGPERSLCHPQDQLGVWGAPP